MSEGSSKENSAAHNVADSAVENAVGGAAENVENDAALRYGSIISTISEFELEEEEEEEDEITSAVELEDDKDDDTSTSSSSDTSIAPLAFQAHGRDMYEVKTTLSPSLSTPSSVKGTPGGASATTSVSKSVFSLFTPFDSEDVSTSEEPSFDQIWGKQSEWAFGKFVREMAKSVHKEHYQKAVAFQGAIPTGPRLKTPSAWVDSTDLAPLKNVASAQSSLGSVGKNASRSGESQKQQVTLGPVNQTDPCHSETKKEMLTEIKEEINEEEFLFKEIHPSFSGNFPTLIWSPLDSISPRARLASNFEIVALSFCPHDGDFLVGGTETGLIVLWDLKDRIQAKNEDTYYSTNPSYIESQRVINNQLKWRRSKSGFTQIFPTAVTHKKDSHSSKVINIQWINGAKEWDCKSGKVVPRMDQKKASLQFITTSEDREIKVWDIRSEPKPAINLRFPDKGFSKTSAAKRPPNLQKTISKYSELNNRWSSIYTIEPKHDDMSFSFSTVALAQEYKKPPDKTKNNDEKTIEGAFVGTLNGHVGYLTWEGVPFESATSGSIDSMNTQMFKCYHDGPVNCISRHPVFDNVCLSTGGHVFAIWNLNYPEEPIKWVRYKDVMVTSCDWIESRCSMFKIARADGLLEFWDLLVYSHRPRIDPLSTGNGITMTSDLFIPPKQFIAIADVTSSLRLYCTADLYQPLTEEELKYLEEMLNNESERKTQLREWARKWVSEHVGRGGYSYQPEKQHLDSRQSISNRPKEATDQTSCNPFMTHLYQWYLRRRGEKSVWLDEADKKWFAQEQAHMKNQILANKRWDQKKMDVVMRQLDIKEKRELLRKQRVQEILDQADEIFKASVADIFMKKEIELKASKISVKVDEQKEFDIESAIKETHLLFGNNSSVFEEAKLADIPKFPMKEGNMLKILAKYRQVRMVFNDSRRCRDLKLKWLRNKLRKEVEKHGCELIEWQTKTNTLMRWEKFDRRIRDIEELREIYGLKYNPLWDKDKRVSIFEKRMALGKIRVGYTVPRRVKRKKGLDLQLIMKGGDISVLTPDETPPVLEISEEPKLPELQENVQEHDVEEETVVPLKIESSSDRQESLKESLQQSSSHLPEIKKSVSFVEATSESEIQPGGVLPLPDIVPRVESQQEILVEEEEEELEERPYLETLLSQTVESEEVSESEDFEPDIMVMEKHKDIDTIVDKLSSVYAMLKADVNVKPELHRFKWETTEEYLVSDEEEEKKSGQEEEEAEEEFVDTQPEPLQEEDKTVRDSESQRSEEDDDEFID